MRLASSGKVGAEPGEPLAGGGRPALLQGGDDGFGLGDDLGGTLVIAQELEEEVDFGERFLGGTTDNVLVAVGSAFDELLLLPVGAGMLTLTADEFQPTELTAVTLTGGIPNLPSGGLQTWKGPSKKGTSSSGLFTATVALPGVPKPVKAAGVYLQKSNSAWGYLPSATTGGSIQITVP